MLKRLLVGTLICLGGGLCAQTDALNAQKYWKLRNSFRQDFVKIGIDRGEGIPAAARKPGACIDNVDYVGGYGTMRWGDGMIFQGHYIGFLATEYRLLKNRDKEVTATLNELYYALQAINRVDLKAEQIISSIATNELPVMAESLNGFYLRDDVPREMFENWENGSNKCRCIESSIYTNNNLAYINEGSYQAEYGTNAWSVPSLDQLTSLLLGLKVCHALLDDDLIIQPTPEDPVINLKNEVQQITNRLITNAKDHNWFLLNERGWPVGNGGGELSLMAYPITLIGQQIVGLDYSSVAKRDALFYKKANIYYSAPPSHRAIILDTMGIIADLQIEHFDYPNLFHLGGLSNFELVQLSGIFDLETEIFAPQWVNLTPVLYNFMAADWEDDHKLDDMFDEWPMTVIEWENNLFSDYNQTIAFNLGVASGLFPNALVTTWGNHTENYANVLINAILKEESPSGLSKSFFEDLLNSMPACGAFKFSAVEDWEDPYSNKEYVWPQNWGSEFKWNDPLESDSYEGHEGQFNSLDYLYMHNLYYLVFGDEIPVPYEETYECFCGEISTSDIEGLNINNEIEPDILGRRLGDIVENDFSIHSTMKSKLLTLDFCTEGVFSDLTTIGTRNIKQQFDDYHDIGISLNAFLTDNHNIAETGTVNIESRLVICNTKTFNVLAGGEINLDKGEILIKPGASLLVEGTVNIAQGTKVIIEPGGKIVIKNGGQLNNSGYIQVQAGATFEYEEGATFAMTDNLAELHLDGGDLIIRENADFTFEKSGTQSGQLRFSTWGAHIVAEENTSFLIQGNGLTDPILILEEDADFWSNSTDLNWINMTSGRVDFYKNSRLVGIQPYTANHIHFNGLDTNRGLIVFDQTMIANSVVDSLPVYAPLFYKNTGTFSMTLSEINNEATHLVKIKGMGYNISQTTFNGLGYYLLSAQNTTVFSRVSNCIFNGNLTTVGVIDNSNAEVEFANNTFNDLYAGVHKLDGQATMTCNTFNDFSFAGIVAHNDCVLDMSSNGLGGYNTFVKHAANFGQNIALWNTQSILLNKGYNTFDDQGTLPIINGSLQISPPPGVGVVLPAHQNKWNPANTEPSATRFNVTSATGSAITVLTGSPNNAPCPNPTDDWVSGAGFNLPLTQGTMPSLQTVHFNGISLVNALNTCIEATEIYGGTNDLIALELFEEVLMAYPTLPASPVTDWLARLGAQKMKNTLQRVFESGEITPADNISQFNTTVQRYVNVLNALTSVNLSQTNYKQLFSLEMDKVHLFHLLGKHDLALLTLLNTESCGLDLAEQMYVNHWKKELDEEAKKTYFGYTAEFMDTTWIDTTQYQVPIQQNFGNFGSIIQNVTTIEFFNCSNLRKPMPTENGEQTLNFSVYPNPNQGIFTVNYTLPEKSTGAVTLYTVDGKQIYRFDCYSGEHHQIVDLSQIANGTYFYKFIVDGVGVNQGKFIIN